MAKRVSKRGRKPIFTAAQKRAVPKLLAGVLKREIRRLLHGM